MLSQVAGQPSSHPSGDSHPAGSLAEARIRGSAATRSHRDQHPRASTARQDPDSRVVVPFREPRAWTRRRKQERPVFQRILLAIDASEQSRRALDLTMAVARGFDAEVDVFHVHEVGMVASVGTRSDADALVAAAAEELAQAGVRARGEAITALSGQAAQTLVKGSEIARVRPHSHGDARVIRPSGALDRKCGS